MRMKLRVCRRTMSRRMTTTAINLIIKLMKNLDQKINKNDENDA